IDQNRVLLFHQVRDRERDTGVWRVDDRIDLVDIDPLPRHVGAQIRAVLVVAAEHVDLPALIQQTGILHGHLDRDHRIGAADVGIQARHVIQHADLGRLVLCQRGRCEPQSGTCDQRGTAPRECCPHCKFLQMLTPERRSFRRLTSGLIEQTICFPDSPSRAARQCAYRSASEVSLNFWMRFPVSTSAVYTLPLASTAMAWIQWNWPALRPFRPKLPATVPSSRFSTRISLFS